MVPSVQIPALPPPSVCAPQGSVCAGAEGDAQEGESPRVSEVLCFLRGTGCTCHESGRCVAKQPLGGQPRSAASAMGFVAGLGGYTVSLGPGRRVPSHRGGALSVRLPEAAESRQEEPEGAPRKKGPSSQQRARCSEASPPRYQRH